MTRPLRIVVLTQGTVGVGSLERMHQCYVEDAATGECVGYLPITDFAFEADANNPAKLTLTTFRGRVEHAYEA